MVPIFPVAKKVLYCLQSHCVTPATEHHAWHLHCERICASMMCRSCKGLLYDLLYIALNRRPAIWTPMPWTARTEKHVFESPSEDILWWHIGTYQDNLLLRARGWFQATACFNLCQCFVNFQEGSAEKLRHIVLEVIQDVIAGRTDNHLTSSTSSKGASSRISTDQ